MNAVDRTKAGVASGILSMNRMVGGTFGVAVMGALITTLGKSKLGDLLPQVPKASRDKLAESLGSGAAQVQGGAVGHAVQQAYVSALNDGLRIAAVVAAVGAALSWMLIARGVPAAAPATAAEPAAEGAAAAPAGEPVAAA